MEIARELFRELWWRVFIAAMIVLVVAGMFFRPDWKRLIWRRIEPFSDRVERRIERIRRSELFRDPALFFLALLLSAILSKPARGELAVSSSSSEPDEEPDYTDSELITAVGKHLPLP